MKYSYNWLQKHIEGKLPSPSKIERELTFKAFEVEEVIEVRDDTVFDIKVLPDRAHDALSHIGMAREIVSLLNTKDSVNLTEQDHLAGITKKATLPSPKVVVENTDACPRFMTVTISNIQMGSSDVETKTLLEAIGQKSISNIVDATNYVLYDLGKPMHVFDADKVVGGLTVRFAKSGEVLTTLDGKNITLDESILVIADDEAPLSIAGIKGGTKAEVDINTTNIIIESANFNSTLIRKTSAKIGIKTDAVKRYENGITSELCEPGLLATANLILKIAGTDKTEISSIVDIYPSPEHPQEVKVSLSQINKLLGTELSTERVSKLFSQRGFEYTNDHEDFTVTVPYERLDIRIKEDLIDEISKLVGTSGMLPTTKYENVTPGAFDKTFYYSNLVRDILVQEGFSEVMTYSFSQEGDIAIINSVDPLKNKLRTSLIPGIQNALEKGLYYSQFLGTDTIKVFEIGKVFMESKEITCLTIGVASKNKKTKKTLESDLLKISLKIDAYFGISGVPQSLNIDEYEVQIVDDVAGIVLHEINFDKKIYISNSIIEENINNLPNTTHIKYQTLSNYPFITRDVAFFVPSEIDVVELEGVLKAEAGEPCVKLYQFDRFQKEGEVRVSYGYRMVFQAFDRTLTDAEIEPQTQRVYDKLQERGFETR